MASYHFSSKTGKRIVGRLCCAWSSTGIHCPSTQFTKNISFHYFPNILKDGTRRQKWTSFVQRNRPAFNPTKSSCLCSLHFEESCFESRRDVAREVGMRSRINKDAVPTIDAANTKPKAKKKAVNSKTKKRKLDNEFPKESPKNEHLYHNASVGAIVPAVVNHDENIAPEQSCSASSEVTKSRRKSSQVRKVVRTGVQGKVEEERSITQEMKSEATSSESLQKPECNDLVQDMNNTATICGVLSSSRSENMRIQTVWGHENVAVNRGSETTVIEEDYQRKYFHLLNTMNELQDKFLASQRNFEDLVQAREAYINELQRTLDDKNHEIGSVKQELERGNKRIVELEERRKMQEDEIQHLRKKVDNMKRAENKHQVLKDGAVEVQRIVEKQQQEILEFYKLLTSVTVEKVMADDDSPTAYDKFRCSVKTAQAQELKFMLVHDPEFAEVEYTPLAVDSQSVDASFPEYLKEQIFFESGQAPIFLSRLLKTIKNPDDK